MGRIRCNIYLQVEQMASTGIAREYPLMAEKCTQDRPWVHEVNIQLNLYDNCVVVFISWLIFTLIVELLTCIL